MKSHDVSASQRRYNIYIYIEREIKTHDVPYSRCRSVLVHHSVTNLRFLTPEMEFSVCISFKVRCQSQLQRGRPPRQLPDHTRQPQSLWSLTADCVAFHAPYVQPVRVTTGAISTWTLTSSSTGNFQVRTAILARTQDSKGNHFDQQSILLMLLQKRVFVVRFVWWN